MAPTPPTSLLRRLAPLLTLAALAGPGAAIATPAASPSAPSLAPSPPAAPAAEPAPDRLLPFGGDWAKARGIDLPLPLGVGLFAVAMRRDVEVTDVRVALPGGEPASSNFEDAALVVGSAAYRF